MIFYIDLVLISKQINILDLVTAGFDAAQLFCNCIFHLTLTEKADDAFIVGNYWHNFNQRTG